MRILIVEDEVRLAKPCGTYLGWNTILQISATTASGPDNALSDIYDLVILDVMLPKRTGFSVLQELRLSRKDHAVLMLSARSRAVRPGWRGWTAARIYYLTSPLSRRGCWPAFGC